MQIYDQGSAIGILGAIPVATKWTGSSNALTKGVYRVQTKLILFAGFARVVSQLQKVWRNDPGCLQDYHALSTRSMFEAM